MPSRKTGDKTRHKILRTATKLFAKRGFHGVSFRDIGRPLGLANSSLIYHYATKEKLYAAVLQQVAATLEALVEAVAAEEDDESRLRALFRATLNWANEYPAEAEVSLRELLDNRDRATRVRHWPMTSVVQRMTALLGGLDGDPAITLFHVVGSALYFHAALPTIARLDDRAPEALMAAYRKQVLAHHLRALVPGRPAR